jgi:hypothetical protein
MTITCERQDRKLQAPVLSMSQSMHAIYDTEQFLARLKTSTKQMVMSAATVYMQINVLTTPDSILIGSSHTLRGSMHCSIVSSTPITPHRLQCAARHRNSGRGTIADTILYVTEQDPTGIIAYTKNAIVSVASSVGINESLQKC